MNRFANVFHWIFGPAGTLRTRAPRGILAQTSLLCFLLASAAAHAACGSFGELHANGAVRLPMMQQAQSDYAASSHRDGSPIVGLWQVVYTNSADQSTFNETLDTWHADGTEFESAYLAPAGGNVCAGVWKQTGPRSVTLHHIGWLFNPATPTATATNTFTLDELVTVARDGATYTGSFTFKVWSLDGTPTPVEVTGTIAAARITPN